MSPCTLKSCSLAFIALCDVCRPIYKCVWKEIYFGFALLPLAQKTLVTLSFIQKKNQDQTWRFPARRVSYTNVFVHRSPSHQIGGQITDIFTYWVVTILNFSTRSIWWEILGAQSDACPENFRFASVIRDPLYFTIYNSKWPSWKQNSRCLFC